MRYPFCPSNWQKLKRWHDLGLTKAFITVGGGKNYVPYKAVWYNLLKLKNIQTLINNFTYGNLSNRIKYHDMNIHTVVLFIMRKKPKNNLNVHQQGSGWINIKFWYTHSYSCMSIPIYLL